MNCICDLLFQYELIIRVKEFLHKLQWKLLIINNVLNIIIIHLWVTPHVWKKLDVGTKSINLSGKVSRFSSWLLILQKKNRGSKLRRVDLARRRWGWRGCLRQNERHAAFSWVWFTAASFILMKKVWTSDSKYSYEASHSAHEYSLTLKCRKNKWDNCW